MVVTDVALVIVVGGRKQRLEVFRVAGKVRSGQCAQHRGSKRGDLRRGDDAVTKDLAGVWIHHRHSENAVPLVERWDVAKRQCPLQTAPAFVIDEEENLVLLDGASARASKLVLDVHRLLPAGGLEESHGVQL